MRRRDFIRVLAGSTVAWPLAARAQQRERMRRVGVLMYGDENDYDQKARLSAFMQSLAQSGWADSRNLLVDVRWTAANLDLVRRHAKELVALKPDVLVATSTSVTAAFQQETRAIPIVFVGISDPVGAVHASTELGIDTAFASLARLQASGLVIGNDPFFNRWSEQLAAQALRHAVPAIYTFRAFAAAGGLMSYGGPELRHLYRLAGVYTGRVLKGDKPADMPVQQETRVELILNLKTR